MQSGATRQVGLTRRQVMTAAGASALTLTTSTGQAAPERAASGSVFEDLEGTGKRGPASRGIAGVMVSNGRDVVKTDAEGRWRLAVSEGDSLFVIKPPHWGTPRAPTSVPQFSYLYQPRGSAKDIAWHHAGVAETGPLPRSIDFPLARERESARFEVLLFADTQPQNRLELGYLRDDIIAGALGTRAAFGINHGDVVFDDLSLYPRYLQLLGATGIPWHHCPGNHDMNLEARDDRSSRETWKRVFGPRHYAFQYAGATFILLDNVHYFGDNRGAPRNDAYCGRIGDQQLQFVRNVLAHVPREHLVVVSMHVPLLTYQDPSKAADNTADRNRLLRLLATRQHTVSFSGHMHLTEHHYLSDDTTADSAASHVHHHQVLAAASGGWWGGPHDGRGIPSADSPDGSPNGYHILAVDDARYSTRFVPATGKTSRQLRAVLNSPAARTTAVIRDGSDANPRAPIPACELAACELVVNVFDGGPRTHVSYAIGGRPARVTMQRQAICDPFVARLFARSAAMQKPWVQAVPSSHVWTAGLPCDLAMGAHRVEVRAVDEYGRERVQQLLLEVGPRGALAQPS
jgi:hypothetical protein